MPSVLLAFDDVGMAVQLQEELEARGYEVTWDGGQAGSPTPGGTRADAVLLSGDSLGEQLGAAITAWRALTPPPGLVVVGTSEAVRALAGETRAPFVFGTGDLDALTAAIDTAIGVRFAAEMTLAMALGATGQRGEGDAATDAVRVIRALSRVDLEVVREALRWRAADYVATTAGIDALREERALAIPEVELCLELDGTRTVQTLLRAGPLEPWHTARLLWGLGCVGAVTMTAEPVDLETPARRMLAATRAHLRARIERLRERTYYDVLEVTPHDADAEIDRACQQLAVRFSPEVLGRLDLGPLGAYGEPFWKQILEARATLLDLPSRGRYNDWLAGRRDRLGSGWLLDPVAVDKARVAFARGQEALAAGDVYRAVSELATACRSHPGHPDYEASLCWARYRQKVASGRDKTEAAAAERATAERALAGARAWPRGLIALGLLCVADGDAAAARWHLQEALRVDPNLPIARRLLSRIGPRSHGGA